MKSSNQYNRFPIFSYPEREWPNRIIDKHPIWCSVDLRDGNQSLVNPMDIPKKIQFFEYLVSVGFQYIEVGYPASSDTEYQFLRKLIEENRIPDHVTIQVLTQAREDLIEKTFESLKGVKKAILHFYNSTSIVQRRVVFQKSKEEIIQLARNAARIIQEKRFGKDFSDDGIHSRIQVQYSPESFTGTEPDYALEICEAVKSEISPTIADPIIINLPATVEIYTPNVYADVIEWFGKNISQRESVILSLHTHNDRGTGIAASELGLLAGADRIEGTILGNGERTGNACLVTLALNMFTQGIDPGLDFQDLNRAIQVFEECNGMKVPERHPYAGELVHTAFSGSHQDAIHKGFLDRNEKLKGFRDSEVSGSMREVVVDPKLDWDVPYLPIDPRDIGRDYTAVVRINSQSGKGGASFILERDFGISLGNESKKIFGKIVKEYSDKVGREINSMELKRLYEKHTSDLPEDPKYSLHHSSVE